MGFRVSYFLWLWALVCVSCTQDGTSPYAMWELHEHPDGDFEFYYLSPPWDKADDFSSKTPVYLLGEDEKEFDARVSAWTTNGIGALELGGTRAEEYALDGCDVLRIDEVVDYRGNDGLEFTADCCEHTVIERFFDVPGGAVSFSLEMYVSLPGRDVSLLVEGFGPGEDADVRGEKSGSGEAGAEDSDA